MKSIKERLQEKCKMTNDCWLFLGELNEKGYGILKVNGKRKKAHRLAYEEYMGKIPKKLFVCHKCDIRNCINPGHLFLDDHYGNMEDAKNKGKLIGFQKGHPYYPKKITLKQPQTA